MLEIIKFIDELIRKEYKGNEEISSFYLISLITKAVMNDNEKNKTDLHNYIIKKFDYLEQKTCSYMISIIDIYITLATMYFKKECENLKNTNN